MLQNFFLKLFVILQLSTGRLGVLKESNQQLKDKTDTRQRAGKYGSELQLISFSICQQRRANDAIVHSDGRRASTFGVNDVQGTLFYKYQVVTVFMVNEGSSCDLRATFNWTVTFVQVGFSILLSSQRCVYTLVRKHHGLTWLNLLVGIITDGDAPASCEKQLVLVATKNIQDITEAVEDVCYQQDRTQPVNKTDKEEEEEEEVSLRASRTELYKESWTRWEDEQLTHMNKRNTDTNTKGRWVFKAMN